MTVEPPESSLNINSKCAKVAGSEKRIYYLYLLIKSTKMLGKKQVVVLDQSMPTYCSNRSVIPSVIIPVTDRQKLD